jgi:hypothetical protein
VPVFVNVIVCAAEVDPTAVEGKAKLLGESEIVELPLVPVPVNATVCGEPDALSVTARLAVSAPSAVGLKATDSVQFAPTARDVEQVFPEIRNEPALAPINA